MRPEPDTVLGGFRLWLIVFSEGQAKRAVEVSEGSFVIGRGEECNLVLDDPRVSREHAQIMVGRAGQPLLRDLDSTNGTRVNGQRLGQPVGFAALAEKTIPLRGDDLIQFGDTTVLATFRNPEILGMNDSEQPTDADPPSKV